MKGLGIVLIVVLQWALMEWAWALWYEPFDMDNYDALLKLSAEIQDLRGQAHE